MILENWDSGVRLIRPWRVSRTRSVLSTSKRLTGSTAVMVLVRSIGRSCVMGEPIAVRVASGTSYARSE